MLILTMVALVAVFIISSLRSKQKKMGYLSEGSMLFEKVKAVLLEITKWMTVLGTSSLLNIPALDVVLEALNFLNLNLDPVMENIMAVINAAIAFWAIFKQESTKVAAKVLSVSKKGMEALSGTKLESLFI